MSAAGLRSRRGFCSRWACGLTLWGALAGCAEAPRDAFEAFYKATVARDATLLRSRLCAAARDRVVHVDDVALLQGLVVRTVLARVEERERTEEAAVLEVVDVQGNTTSVSLRREAGRWCIDDTGGSR